jgi:hypothetical protein
MTKLLFGQMSEIEKLVFATCWITEFRNGYLQQSEIRTTASQTSESALRISTQIFQIHILFVSYWRAGSLLIWKVTNGLWSMLQYWIYVYWINFVISALRVFVVLCCLEGRFSLSADRNSLKMAHEDAVFAGSAHCRGLGFCRRWVPPSSTKCRGWKLRGFRNFPFL